MTELARARRTLLESPEALSGQVTAVSILQFAQSRQMWLSPHACALLRSRLIVARNIVGCTAFLRKTNVDGRMKWGKGVRGELHWIAS
jgi:hypothetical protein